ncbi:META domain-containing protein [Acinetobacter johnsonii]|uniref:META domain-containing protein n=1 Tax=Acinetobacter johnsonii TaxID=40214 RepID=A0AA42MQX3_ACIJO|nr:META domain-containing protein [Acinetobacter johnsonii]MDH0968145.1 META domain-containing protein [Acinetobacter johnsonii]QQT92867.1 META domain-containing protein [Acinetobacter johnsonii]QYA55584.1 META domain-containing protein [Acinetobacter johnsonii]WQN47861.1 META domain-containing protein [Acinetobacter johnsonii]
MLKKLIASSLLASSLIMTGCQTTPSPSDTIEMANIQQLQQRTWILTQIGNTEIKTAPNERNIPSLQFSADNRISGADGCNRIMGSYTVGRDTLTLSQLATTRMACINNSAVPQQFQEALAKVTHYQVFGKTLKLLDRHGNLLLQFGSAIQPR